jgi:hypothetical protein
MISPSVLKAVLLATMDLLPNEQNFDLGKCRQKKFKKKLKISSQLERASQN